jgi:hypothetical protein
MIIRKRPVQQTYALLHKPNRYTYKVQPARQGKEQHPFYKPTTKTPLTIKIPSYFVWLGGAALTETLIIFSFSSVFSSTNGAPSPASQNLITAPAAAPNGTRTYNLAWKARALH